MKVYIVAGEPSGDLLASGLMRAIRRRVPGVRFRGVGGESMMACDECVKAGDECVKTDDERVKAGDECVKAGGRTGAADGKGFKSLFDISEISVMGVFEVLPRLPLILRRINQTIRDIEDFEPDVLVTVDSWGFVSALLTRLRKKWRRESALTGSVSEHQVPVIHYVAPQVWAWKKGRAKNVARLVDRLMTLLPDEGQWFEKHGLQCDFVGHPVVERVSEAVIDGNAFRAANGILDDVTVISVLPGSRHSEVKRLLPVFRAALARLAERHENLFAVVPTVSGVEAEVERGFAGFPVPTRVVTGEEGRYNAFAISKLALAKSGTVSLELVSFGVPHMIAYTFSLLTNLTAKLLVRVRFANLINILAGREIVPEFVLDNCRPELITECAERLLKSPKLAENQIAEASKVMGHLRLPDILPSDRAAEIVSEAAKGNLRKQQA